MSLILRVLSLVTIFFFGMANKIDAQPERSYSLRDGNGVPLDQKLVKLMNFRNGTFIEVGAHDGVSQSNTKRFEEFYGWTGVLIEPSPNLFQKLCSNRPNSKCFQCALGSFQQDGSFIFGDFIGDLMSSVNGTRLSRNPTEKVPVRSLQTILDELNIQQINFFSLDTEGYELQILLGIDFNRTTFDYLLIEIYPGEHYEIMSLLETHGYEFIENFSNYSRANNWDGTHNDYLFRRVNSNY